MNTEDELQRVLHDRADHVAGGLSLDDVRSRARTVRRRRRTTAVGAAAAVVAAISVPVALNLGGGPDASHPMPAHTGTGTPSPTAAPTPTGTPTSAPTTPAQTTAALSKVPLGPVPAWTYAVNGVVHLRGGGTSRLPGADRAIDQFASYHGGWIVIDAQTQQATVYDGQGAAQGHGPSMGVVASSDGMQLGYVIGRTAYVGVTSGMAQGEQHVAVPPNTTPVGFLSTGLLYCSGNTDTQPPRCGIVGGSGSPRIGPLGSVAAATDQGDLVAGSTTGGGVVVDTKTGRALWTDAPWTPTSFSADGKYVAALGGATGADTEAAILDAHTGQVVARTSLQKQGLGVSGGPGFDADGNLLFTAVPTAGKNDGMAVLRLTRSGKLDRATPVAKPHDPNANAAIVLATGP